MTNRERIYLRKQKLNRQLAMVERVLMQSVIYPTKPLIRVREDDVIDYCDFCAGIGSLITSPCPYCNNGVKK